MKKFAVFSVLLAVLFMDTVTVRAHDVPKKEVVTYSTSSVASSVNLRDDQNEAFPYLYLRVDKVSKSTTDVPPKTYVEVNIQLYGNCSMKACDWISVSAEIPAESYSADEATRTARLALDLGDPAVQFLFGWHRFQDGTYEELMDFPAFLAGSADLAWRIPEEFTNQGSGEAVLTFTDICGGRGRTDASQQDGAAEMTGNAFGYTVPGAPFIFYGPLVFREETTTTRSGCGPVTMPQVVFGYGGRG